MHPTSPVHYKLHKILIRDCSHDCSSHHGQDRDIVVVQPTGQRCTLDLRQQVIVRSAGPWYLLQALFTGCCFIVNVNQALIHQQTGAAVLSITRPVHTLLMYSSIQGHRSHHNGMNTLVSYFKTKQRATCAPSITKNKLLKDSSAIVTTLTQS